MTNAENQSDQAPVKITPLQSRDCLKHFSCGETEIDRWAKSKAHKLHEKRRSRVHCARANAGESVVGFYSLSLSTEQSSKLQADHRDAWKNGAPLVYIEYLAILKSRQNQKLGSFLLLDALRKSYEVANLVAPYGVALRSLNEKTTQMYQKFGFGIAPDEGEKPNPLMILPIWTIVNLFEDP